MISKNTGAINPHQEGGNKYIQYRVDATPIDGLKIGADYSTEDGGETGAAQPEESGAYYAQYAMGNFKVGYGKSLYAPALTAKNGAKTMYETDSYGIEFAVNDALSLSVTKEKSEATQNNAIVAGASGGVKTKVEADIDTYQVAYVIGGAFLYFIKITLIKLCICIFVFFLNLSLFDCVQIHYILIY